MCACVYDRAGCWFILVIWCVHGFVCECMHVYVHASVCMCMYMCVCMHVFAVASLCCVAGVIIGAKSYLLCSEPV